jgi:hypothetical protein
MSQRSYHTGLAIPALVGRAKPLSKNVYGLPGCFLRVTGHAFFSLRVRMQ